jgi:hypothetical protein
MFLPDTGLHDFGDVLVRHDGHVAENGEDGEAGQDARAPVDEAHHHGVPELEQKYFKKKNIII